MRMVKMKPKPMDLETAMQKFLLVKGSQHTGEETVKLNIKRGRAKRSPFSYDRTPFACVFYSIWSVPEGTYSITS